MHFYFFRRYFLSSRSSSLIKLISRLCLFSITVSITALILIVSIMKGFGEAIKSRLLVKQAHLTIEFNKNSIFKEDINSNKTELFLSNLTKKQKEGIKNTVIFEVQDLILKSQKGFKGVSAKGYSQKQWNKKLKTALTLENSLNKSANDFVSPPLLLKIESNKEILLSHELSLEANLFANDTAIFIPLASLLLPPSLPPPVKHFKIKAILPPAETLEEKFSVYYKEGSMNFGDFSNINHKAEIQLKQAEQVKTYQQIFKQYKTTNWMEQNSNLFFALKLEKFIMILFLVLTFIISCLGISSALLLLMTQKRQDIAILRAIGLSQKELVKTFTKIGVYLSSFGIALGAVAGILGTLSLKYNRFNLLPQIYQDRTIPVVFMPLNYLIIIAGAFALAWFFCYLPSRYFSKSKIIELLKTN